MNNVKLRSIIKEVLKNEFLNEALFNTSTFIEELEEYGSIVGIVHEEEEKVSNWFSIRKIDYNKYKDQITLPAGFLNNINVDEEYRGQGFGNELYESFEAECYDAGATCIILESDSGENQMEGFNLDKWYESLGYKKIGVEGGNFIMIKKLD